MQNIAVVYGGKSPEHDVSILTGLHLVKNITEDYKVTLVYITKENKLVYGSKNIDDYITGKAERKKQFIFTNKICCVINCCHGGIGESGELAALMKIYGIPFTSCNSISAWKQQSKIETRKILTSAGFVQPKFEILTDVHIDKVKLSLPLIVKPDMLGSSIGITVARTKQQLQDGVKLALSLCDKVIVEELIEDMKEVNVAVMRHNGQIITSGLELVSSEKFFSFEEKYLNPESGFIKKSGKSLDDILLEKLESRIKKLAVSSYLLFESTGVVRTDFIIKDDKIILNENNTVPGFMAYHLWLKKNIPYGVVIDDLIKDAIARNHEKKTISHFKSDILIKNKQLVVEI